MTPRNLAVLQHEVGPRITAEDHRLVDHNPLPGVRPLDDFKDQVAHATEAYAQRASWASRRSTGNEFRRICLSRERRATYSPAPWGQNHPAIQSSPSSAKGSGH